MRVICRNFMKDVSKIDLFGIYCYLKDIIQCILLYRLCTR